MKNLPVSPAVYFEKFDTSPIFIKPFDPQSRVVAAECLSELNSLLDGFEVELCLRGSTAFGIAGKGDIDLGIYCRRIDWESVLARLIDRFGDPGNLEQDYARFEYRCKSSEIEIILLKGYAAKVDRCLTAYLASHFELLHTYEKIKLEHSKSKREYQIEKDRFLRAVIEMIPDEEEQGQ